MKYDDYDDYRDRGVVFPVKAVESAVEFPDVNTLGESSRIGDSEREKAVTHIEQMTGKGYLSAKESAIRLKHAASAETEVQLRNLTIDLPPYADTRPFYDRYWLPTYIAGMMLSACLAVIPTTVLVTEKVYPEKAYGIALGILTVIMGIFGFVSGIIGIAVRCNDLPPTHRRV